MDGIVFYFKKNVLIARKKNVVKNEIDTTIIAVFIIKINNCYLILDMLTSHGTLLFLQNMKIPIIKINLLNGKI